MKKTLVALLVVSAATTAAAQDAGFASRTGAVREAASIGTARELYATARYDEALALLNSLRSADALDVSERTTIEQYRSLCLLALGRDQEAETAIGNVVTTDPFFVPNESDASPRVRGVFSDVRTRLLPDIVSSRYAEAKRLFDQKEHAAAERQFRELVRLLDDPQMHGRLPDLRTLATGFLELAAAAAAPPPEPVNAEPEPLPAAPAAPAVPRVYSGDEPGITAPVPVRQPFPSVPASIVSVAKDRGVLELTIDERGRVVAITVRSSMHPVYDALLVGAARDWKYRPATLNGAPVPFRKFIQVSLSKR